MRGYGESDRPKDRRAYDLSELTADVSEVIKALGHKECASSALGCQYVSLLRCECMVKFF